MFGTAGGTEETAVLWVSDAILNNAGEVWITLKDAFVDTGLWPVVLQANDTDDDDGRPWVTREFDPQGVTPPSSLDPAATMKSFWDNNIAEADTDDGDLAARFGSDFPGLAATPTRVEPDSIVDEEARPLRGRIGLVVAERPADIPATIGWLGATNYMDAGYVSAVLRSWEARFGAVLVRMGFDYLQVVIRRPPTNLDEAMPIAAEHFAFCPDQITQGDYDSVDEYAESLVGAPSWYCWWD